MFIRRQPVERVLIHEPKRNKKMVREIERGRVIADTRRAEQAKAQAERLAEDSAKYPIVRDPQTGRITAIQRVPARPAPIDQMTQMASRIAELEAQIETMNAKKAR